MHATRTGLIRFRRQLREGKASRAARLWAEIRGLLGLDGELTEAGQRFIAGGSARRAAKGGKPARARTSGKARTRSKVPARLCVEGAPAGGGGAGGHLAEEGRAHEWAGGDEGLREARSRAPRGLQDASRDWRAGTVWHRLAVDREAAEQRWRELRAENARRNGL